MTVQETLIRMGSRGGGWQRSWRVNGREGERVYQMRAGGGGCVASPRRAPAEMRTRPLHCTGDEGHGRRRRACCNTANSTRAYRYDGRATIPRAAPTARGRAGTSPRATRRGHVNGPPAPRHTKGQRGQPDDRTTQVTPTRASLVGGDSAGSCDKNAENSQQENKVRLAPEHRPSVDANEHKRGGVGARRCRSDPCPRHREQIGGHT